MARPAPSFAIQTPEGEDRPRRVCTTCGFIDYVNPKIVVGAVVAWSEGGPAFGEGAVPMERVKILLCRRAIMPRRGYWTLPAGYMEEQETVLAAVAREAREEACTELKIDALLGIYDVPARSQVHLMHRAGLEKPEFAAGPESLEVKLFGWDEIPRRSLAFKSVSWALRDWLASREQAAFPPFRNPPTSDWVTF